MTADPPPRLAPLPTDQWGDDAVAALRNAFSDKTVNAFRAGPAPNVLATMLHHPALAGAFNQFGNLLLREPAIGHRARELMLLRVAWRTRALYEWVHHARLAEQYGLDVDDIDAISRGDRAKSWTSLERDLVAATDQMLDHYRVNDETWQRLAGQLDERQLVEVPFIVGAYTCLAMAFNSWELRLEEGLDMTGIPLPPR